MKWCIEDGCGELAKVRGLCFGHLYAAKRADRARVHAGLQSCSVPDCDRPHQARGLCGAHYARARRDAPLTPPAPTPSSELHAEGWGRLDPAAPRHRPMEVLLVELAERNGVPCWPVTWVTNSARGRLSGGEAA